MRRVEQRRLGHDGDLLGELTDFQRQGQVHGLADGERDAALGQGLVPLQLDANLVCARIEEDGLEVAAAVRHELLRLARAGICDLTAAPGITPPLSWTMPLILPRVSCAVAARGSRAARSNTHKSRRTGPPSQTTCGTASKRLGSTPVAQAMSRIIDYLNDPAAQGRIGRHPAITLRYCPRPRPRPPGPPMRCGGVASMSFFLFMSRAMPTTRNSSGAVPRVLESLHLSDADRDRIAGLDWRGLLADRRRAFAVHHVVEPADARLGAGPTDVPGGSSR